MSPFLLPARDIQEENLAFAFGLLGQVLQWRRSSDDWRLLGMRYLQNNQPTQALSAVQQALALRPTRPMVHQWLAEAYRQLGDGRRAQGHEEKYQWRQSYRRE